MNDLKHISSIPIIICGSFIAGGLFLDAELSLPLWAHRGLEVIWIGIWGLLAIYWIIVQTRPETRASRYAPPSQAAPIKPMQVELPAAKPSLPDAKQMVKIYRQYKDSHR